MRSPFGWLAPGHERRVFLALLVSTLVVLAGVRAVGGPLRTEAAPQGIVSFEFAGTLAEAHRMMASWGASGRVYAGLSLGLDYLFLVLYGLTLALACVRTGRVFAARAPRLHRLGEALAWGVLLAAALDAVENYALIRVLLGASSDAWAAVAYGAALPKFILLAAALLYLLAGLPRYFFAGKR
jgi:hypothetical protein